MWYQTDKLRNINHLITRDNPFIKFINLSSTKSKLITSPVINGYWKNYNTHGKKKGTNCWIVPVSKKGQG